MNAINYNEMSVVYGQGGRVARRCMRDVSGSKGNSEGRRERGMWGRTAGGGTLYVAVAVSEQAGATERTIRVAVGRTITGICRAIVAPYVLNLRCY